MMLIGDEPQSYPSYRDIAEEASVSRVGTVTLIGNLQAK